MFRILTEALAFPSVDLADPDGILALAGDLRPERLMLAYRSGIFPWYSDDEPIIWWAPDPRFVLFPDQLCISKSMQRIVRSNWFRATRDAAFEQVIHHCRHSPRPGQPGTWITDAMEQAYIALHRAGHAHSVEVWTADDELVGGLYGVVVGSCFCGESMFSRKANASKYALVKLVEHLTLQGFRMIDSQVHNDHMAGLGAEEIPRTRYMELLGECLNDDVLW